MNSAELLLRVRQLRALDLTAADVYADLGLQFPDEKGRAMFLAMSADERRHASLEEELIELLTSHERKNPNEPNGKTDGMEKTR